MSATTKVALALVAGLGISGLFNSEAQAQQGPQNCGPRDGISENLAENYSEQQMGVGIVNESLLAEFYANEEGGFTYITTDTNGNSCIQVTGTRAVIDPDLDASSITQELTLQQQNAFTSISMRSRGQCNEMNALFNSLRGGYQEVPIIVAQVVEGNYFMIFDTPDDATKPDGSISEDSWSVVNVSMNEQIGAYQACVMGGGTDWQLKEPGEIIRGQEVSYTPEVLKP